MLSTSAEELRQIEGVGPHSAFGVRLVQEMAREFLKGKIVDQPFLKSSREIFDYLYHSVTPLKLDIERSHRNPDLRRWYVIFRSYKGSPTVMLED